ncbi:hypothetical protein [Glaciecola petra]|uniref:Motility protein n=1 Tax=Glaciecola petra TaxID=3075602 RepID=A0ABU2ZL68_9ALTE|nr:hypothetical protein [Aestuariibacter sp. P117]MDT0593370.1 hypothetical protein [Aestuariibacter sp. P117]
MDIQGSTSLNYALQVKSAQLANNQQKQEGQAVLQLLESAAAVPAPSTSSSGSLINTYA